MIRRPRAPTLFRYVYVIGPTEGLQKVGMATDPRSRLAALQTASPADLMVHAAIAVPFGAAPGVEHQAHRLLARSCVRNEWFETTPSEAVAAVYAAALPWMDKPKPQSSPAAPVHPSPSEWRISRASRPAPLPLFAPPSGSGSAPSARTGREVLPVDLLPLFRSTSS